MDDDGRAVCPLSFEAVAGSIDCDSSDDGTDVQEALVETNKASTNSRRGKFSHVHRHTVGLKTHGEGIDESSSHESPEVLDSDLDDHSDESNEADDDDGPFPSHAAGQDAGRQAADDPTSEGSATGGGEPGGGEGAVVTAGGFASVVVNECLHVVNTGPPVVVISEVLGLIRMGTDMGGKEATNHCSELAVPSQHYTSS